MTKYFFFFQIIYKIGEKSFNFPKSDCMEVISLSTYITNTVRYIRHVSQAFTIRHSYSIHYTKSLLNLFQADKFDINCSGCISEDLRTVTQNPHVPAARARPLKPCQFGSLIPPTLRKKSTPLLCAVLGECSEY